MNPLSSIGTLRTERTAPVASSASSASSAGLVGLVGAIGAEWTKLWSVRAPYACLLAGLLLTGVFTFYYAALARINDQPIQPLGNAPVSSVVLGQFVIVVLAMTTVTGEYATGSVRTSLQWVPVRHRMQLAKAVVAAVVAFAAGVLFAVLGMAVAWTPFRGHAVFDPATAIPQALAMGLYCALTAVLTVGVSFALRAAAGTLAALFVLIFALPALCTALGGPFLLTVHDYLPQTAGSHFMLADGRAPYPTVAALLIVLAWTAAAHLTGRFVLRRRDG
ncbi:ABC transporter permease [Streptomyces sp. NPDC059949]|uniref:ABC transporter permease n=1 Tax=Streptomyces sp. NPDC059949 TaxID=3347013 RepID=UPI003657D216